MLCLASNPVLHNGSLCEKIIAGIFKLRHLPSNDQVADLFSKPLYRPRFEQLRSKLQICSPLELVGGDYQGLCCICGSCYLMINCLKLNRLGLSLFSLGSKIVGLTSSINTSLWVQRF